MASVHVILSARAVRVAAKEVEVTEKARTASMMARKSRVEMVICCGGDAKVLGPATSVGAVVLGAGGSRRGEEAGAVGNGVVVDGARTEDVGA